jgi:two-component system, chemotaxis family, sensor kinase Cph1
MVAPDGDAVDYLTHRHLRGFLQQLRHDADVFGIQMHHNHQVWTNLIANAVKFASPDRALQINVTGSVEKNRAVYKLQDNGVGFDMAYEDKLFGLFQSLHAPGGFAGTGVGLAIVKRAVERHGGEVWAEGKVGEGATFFFALPIAGKGE